MLNAETIKISNTIFFLQNKAIQCVPKSAYSSRFITYAPSFIFLVKLPLEKSSYVREPALTNPFPFLFPEPALIIPFPDNKFPNKLAPKVPNSTLKNPTFC